MTKPKTDAEDAAWREGHSQGVADQVAITASVQRKLEAMTELRDRVSDDLGQALADAQVYCQERDEARAVIAQWHEWAAAQERHDAE